MKIYISYFYAVRFFKPYQIPMSTAVWDPKWWRGVKRELRWYLFLEHEPYKYIGHNPLAHTAMLPDFGKILP